MAVPAAATYDESIRRFLDVFEAVNREVPFDGLRWSFDHAETVTQPSLERVKAPGGGIAIQHRMAYQGEYFIDRYGRAAAGHTPPVARMLGLGLPVGAGSDATRVASYNPWVACTGWSRARRSAARRCTATTTGSTAWRRCGATRWAAPGSPARTAEGGDHSRPACRPGGPVGGLLLSARGADQGNRVRVDARGWPGRARIGRVRPTGPAAVAGPARLVANEGLPCRPGRIAARCRPGQSLLPPAELARLAAPPAGEGIAGRGPAVGAGL